MSVFILESNEIDSISTTIDSLATETSDLSSTVSSFDVSCDDFDFNIAKQSIASNIDACYQKIKNTSLFMKEVVSSHTSLQNAMTSTKSQAEETIENETNKNRARSGYSSSNYSGSSTPKYNSSSANVSVIPSVVPPISIESKPISESSKKIEVIDKTFASLEKIDEEQIKAIFTEEKGTEWCNELINLCAKDNGYENTDIIPKFKTADEGLKWFQTQELFKKATYVPNKGDLVFIDIDNDTIADQVAFVTEIKDNKIFTIEGNNEEKLIKNSYDLNSKNILGYGTPKYEELLSKTEIKEV